MDVENSYFPLMVSDKALTKEEEHIEGFVPEVLELYQWVYEELVLAFPAIKGVEGEVEKYHLCRGRGVHGATSLFGKANFDIYFKDGNMNEYYISMVWKKSVESFHQNARSYGNGAWRQQRTGSTPSNRVSSAYPDYSCGLKE